MFLLSEFASSIQVNPLILENPFGDIKKSQPFRFGGSFDDDFTLAVGVG